MKKNHEQVEALIIQALRACNYDSTLSETKSFLTVALESVSKVAKKRNRNTATQKAIEEAKKKAQTQQQLWWEMIKKNAVANFDLGELDDEQ